MRSIAEPDGHLHAIHRRTERPLTGRRVDQFDLVAVDADDTLWRCEDAFRAAEHRFVELVQPHAPDGVDAGAALTATERSDLSVTGYGAKAFTLSMIRASITVTEGTVPTAVIEELLDVGRDLLTEQVHLLPHVPEVLAKVASATRVMMITKGDLVHQTRKVTTSGIEHHFAEIEIVLEKDTDTYSKILHRLGVAPERFCMIGNSVRSDILPVMSLGGHAVHIPYHLTWELERVDGHDEDVTELATIADLPAWLGLP
jgi:putative hydrolase of the HAD superfamily